MAHLFNELGYWAQLAHRVEKIPIDGDGDGESDMGEMVMVMVRVTWVIR